MNRAAYGFLVGNALLMGALAIVTALALDLGLRDPDGFLGPSWVRLPLMVLGAFVADVVPRSLWRVRGRVHLMPAEARRVVKEHWTRQRVALVVIGLASFYVTYVSYRNLKGALPFLRPTQYDFTLHAMDRALFFGVEPALVLQAVLGTGISAHILSFVYLLFLPMVPISLVAWLVWSRNISFGYWFATSNCLAWTLGTLSYYLVPSQGPAFYFPWLYADLATTDVTSLQRALETGRKAVLLGSSSEEVQSVAGFASLHVAITLVLAMIAQYTVRHAWIRRSIWAFFVLTVISTIYFGWHYIADDVAGVVIAVVSVYVGGLATGQKFDRRLRSSYPTTTTATVPVDD